MRNGKKTTVTLAYIRWFDSSITTGHTCTPEEATGVLENESAGAKDTIISLLVCVGQKCEDFLAVRLKDIPAKNIQADEIWGYVRMKEKMRLKKKIESEEVGDAYCFTAIERKTKIILAWHLGKRDAINTVVFVNEVENNTRGRFQISTDGWGPYKEAIPVIFESENRKVDHAAVVKTYGKFEDDHRYSPSDVLETTAKIRPFLIDAGSTSG